MCFQAAGHGSAAELRQPQFTRLVGIEIYETNLHETRLSLGLGIPQVMATRSCFIDIGPEWYTLLYRLILNE